MDDKELGRLLRISQGTTDEGQKKMLASNFGLVASELLLVRAELVRCREKEEWFKKALVLLKDSFAKVSIYTSELNKVVTDQVDHYLAGGE